MRWQPSKRPASIGILAIVTLFALTFDTTQRGWAQGGDDPGSDDQIIGVVEPSHEVELSAQLPGQLKSVAVDVDDVVEKDQVLAQLDDALQAVVVEASRLRADSNAEIEAAEASVTEAQGKLDQANELKARGGPLSAWELTEREVALKQAQARLSAAQNEKQIAQVNLRLEQEKLKRYSIRAPFAGKVLKVAAEPGATVNERDPIVTVIAVDPLEAALYLPKDLQSELEKGREYQMEAQIDGKDVTLIGKLKSVAPKIDFGSGTVRCEFAIANSDQSLRPGFSVRLLWPQPQPQPQAAAEAP